MKKKILCLLMIAAIIAFNFIPKEVNAEPEEKRTNFEQREVQNDIVSANTNIEEYIGHKKQEFEGFLEAEGLSNPESSNIDYNSLFGIEEGDYKYAVINSISQPNEIIISGNQVQEYTVAYTQYNVSIAQANKSIIRFEGNGGHGSMDSVEIEKGSVYALPENGFGAPEGKEFEKWDVEGLGDRMPHDEIQVTADELMIRAMWKDNEEENQHQENEKINVLNINVANPKIGEKLEITEVEGEYGPYYEFSTFPNVTGDKNANYSVEWTSYITSYPSMGDNYDTPFEGTFESGKDYYVEVSLHANPGYVFTDNEHMTVKVNGKTDNYELNEYNMDGTEYFLIYVKIKPANTSENLEEYTITNGDVTVNFKDLKNHEYELVLFDVLNLTKEEISQLGITEEQFNEIYNQIVNNTKQYGKLLKVYAIEIGDSTRDYTGETNIKIKITDEMKKYNSFKMIYLDDENNFKVEDVVELKIEGDYLVGTLPHLSAYALVGDNVSNPKTGDNITFFISILTISVIGLITTRVCLKKKVK